MIPDSLKSDFTDLTAPDWKGSPDCNPLGGLKGFKELNEFKEFKEACAIIEELCKLLFPIATKVPCQDCLDLKFCKYSRA